MSDVFIVLPEDARQRIFKYLSKETDSFLSQVNSKLERFAEKWQLSNIVFMHTNTVNLLFSCVSGLYGDCVLKMCIPGNEVATEINCLRAYNGNGYCKLWDFCLSDGILLLEKQTPGEQMWTVSDYRKRAFLFATTVKNLHIPYSDINQFPTYLSWMEKIHSTLTDMGGIEDVLFYLNEAMKTYSILKQRYNKTCLLHGDLHQENLLLNSKGSYTIIDPKGVVDDPVMEVARFLINETPCNENKIREMAAIMSPILNIAENDILKSMFIDAALSSSWSMEEHYLSDEAFEEGKRNAAAECKFAFDLIKQTE